MAESAHVLQTLPRLHTEGQYFLPEVWRKNRIRSKPGVAMDDRRLGSGVDVLNICGLLNTYSFTRLQQLLSFGFARRVEQHSSPSKLSSSLRFFAGRELCCTCVSMELDTHPSDLLVLLHAQHRRALAS